MTLIFCLVFSSLTLAQKNEVSFSVGAINTVDLSSNHGALTCVISLCGAIADSTSTGVAFEGNYARRLLNFRAGSLDLEFPVVGAPSRDTTVGLAGFPALNTLSTWIFFFTPSARIKLLPSRVISPFFNFGGGLAHSSSSFTIGAPILGPAALPFPLPGSSESRSSNNSALQFGGGADFKTPLPHLAIRAELRDFWARGFAQPSGVVLLSPDRQHNIFASGGVVFKF
jgi:hypothetical protein